MSPAGYWPQLNAAIEAGADAVYFGLEHFSARAKVGFALEELPDVMRTLRTRGVKGYVTFNTLVFDAELDSAAKALAEISSSGADAIIVQDLGMVKLAREIAPGLAIHGSTQMSITSAEGIALAMRYGVSRVVLARELSAVTGESITDAVLEAIRERLARKRLGNHAPHWREEVTAIQDRLAKLPRLTTQTDEEILGYDENGLPS